MKKMGLAVTALTLAASVPAGVGVSSASTGFCDLPEADRPPLTEPVELCGTTELAGDAAGVVRVTLRQAATIAPAVGEDGGVEIEGTGPFTGVALVEDPPSVESRGFVAAATSAERDGTTFIGLGPAPDCSPCSLPAGDYRLYLLTKDRPSSVTLHLEGLSGSVALTPFRSTPFEARDFTRQINLGHNLVGMTSGDTFELTAPGFLYQGIRLLGVEVTGTGVFACDAEPLPAYLPLCREGNTISGGPTWIGHGRDPSVTGHSVVPAGEYAQGAWFASPVPPTRVHAVGVWLTFN